MKFDFSLPHLKSGYDGLFFNTRTCENSNFHIEIAPTSREVLSWYEEAQNLCRQIVLHANDLGKDVRVLFSGGKDSEAVLRLFLSIGYTPKVSVVRYLENANIVEVSYAVTALEELKVPYDLIDFDIRKYISSGKLKSFIRDRVLTYPDYIYVYEAAIRTNDDFIVIGNEGFQLTKEGYYEAKSTGSYPSSLWQIGFDEKSQGFNTLFGQDQRLGVPSFFSCTPEILLSFLRDPFILEVFSNKHPDCWHGAFKVSEYFYKKWFPQMRIRPKIGSTVSINFDFVELAFKEVNSLDINFTHAVNRWFPVNPIVQYLEGKPVDLSQHGGIKNVWNLPDKFQFDTSNWKRYRDVRN